MTTMIVTHQDTLDLATYLDHDTLERVHGTVSTPAEWLVAMVQELGEEAVMEAAARVHVDVVRRVRATLAQDGR